VEHLPHDDAGHDPSDGAEHPDDGEVAGGILDVMERDRVAERQGGHVTEGVSHEQGIEPGPLGLAGEEPHEARTRQVEHGEQLFGGEEAVRHHPDEKWGDEGREGGGPVGQADLPAGESERLTEIGAHRDEPAPPDEILEEHHRREANPGEGHGRTRRRIDRKATRSPWSWSAMCPEVPRPYRGHCANLVVRTSSSHSGDQSSYATTRESLSHC